MRPTTIRLMTSALLLGTGATLGGCIVVPPHHRDRVVVVSDHDHDGHRGHHDRDYDRDHRRGRDHH